MSVVLLSVLSSLGAGDLGGTTPRGYAWNSPLQCPDTQAATKTEMIKIIADKIAKFCEIQNEDFRAHGYLSCPTAMCFEKYVEGGKPPVPLTVRIQYNATEGDFSVSVQYKTDFSNSRSNSISCWSPFERAQEIVLEEKDSWSFDEYLKQYQGQ